MIRRVKASVALAFLIAAPAPAAAPTLLDLYQVGELGFVEFRLQGGRYVGKYRGGGTCGLLPDVEVMKGVMEGTVFVGTVLLCQQGPACDKEKSYPFLGVWHDGALAGSVKLDASCTSPVLDSSQLLVTPASAEDRARVIGGQGSSAAALGKTKKQLEEEAEALLIEGIRKVGAGDYRPAGDLLERGLAYLPDHWQGLSAAGVAQTKLGNPAAAVDRLERAIAAAQREKATAGELSELHYNMACALAAQRKPREAVESLRTAMRLGGAANFLDALTSDTDLEPLHGDADYKKLLAEAKKAKGGKGPR